MTRPKGLKSSKPRLKPFDSDSGLYVLLLHVDRPVTIRVGARGEVAFKIGYYAYSGSARRNLSRRLARHKARRKKLHWHIDYLTSHHHVRVVSAHIFSAKTTSECDLNSEVQRLPFAEPVPGFGSSDCRCFSHLSFLGHLSVSHDCIFGRKAKQRRLYHITESSFFCAGRTEVAQTNRERLPCLPRNTNNRIVRQTQKRSLPSRSTPGFKHGCLG